MKIIFASQNKNKIAEIRAKLPHLDIQGLDPLVFPEELLETGDTLDHNALQKARQVYDKINLTSFADDTGLEVEQLNGAPGIYSARYAGEQRDSEANMDLLLKNLTNQANRKARFKTVIALILGGKEYLFEGICEGEITHVRSGAQGFGYDPIFVPAGYSKTFAEMTMAEKSNLSHRGKALEKLVDFLNELDD
ncbi:MAG TPA: non-canonical purine NTP pyrophosphatase, RdgB/HAM1 family [Bacteroidetes bacterium]|jgi:XTP/dITP diphosphohydrolase|nr:non-canonical purine NTP pyrophosphatase, RdgB/HAM1 family [Bacteroidota bacterium]